MSKTNIKCRFCGEYLEFIKGSGVFRLVDSSSISSITNGTAKLHWCFLNCEPCSAYVMAHKDENGIITAYGELEKGDRIAR